MSDVLCLAILLELLQDVAFRDMLIHLLGMLGRKSAEFIEGDVLSGSPQRRVYP